MAHNILVIDHDAQLLELLTQVFTKYGYEVFTARDGEEGFKIFAERTVDVILLDAVLPKKSGFDVCKEVRRSGPRGEKTGLIMATGLLRSDIFQKQAMQQAKVDALFYKPFSVEDLISKTKELAERSRPGQGARVKPAADVASSPPSQPPKAQATQASARDQAPSAAGPGRSVTQTVVPAPSPTTGPPGPTGHRARGTDAVLAQAGPVGRAADIAVRILATARARFSGVLRLVSGADELKLGFLRGIFVGATDNLREQLLGERLWRSGRLTNEQMLALNARMVQKRERVAEALLALGFVQGPEALALVDSQARSRLRRALAWRGRVEFIADETQALPLAVGAYDLTEVILEFAVEPSQAAEATSFVLDHKTEALKKTAGFEAGLAAWARLRPQSTLPGLFFSGDPTVAQAAASASSSSDVYALWLAGLVTTPNDPLVNGSIPRPTLHDLPVERVDAAAVDLVCSTLLRVRGRSAHDFLELPPTASGEQIRERISAMRGRVGRDVLSDKALGPAKAAARELWDLIDEAEMLSLQGGAPVAVRPAAIAQPHRGLAAEERFLLGQLALADGKLEAASGYFDEAVKESPDDPEYGAHLAWVQILMGERDLGLSRLSAIQERHPEAVRPQFFRGLLAMRDGDVAGARRHLSDCVARAPHDVEIMTALVALG